MMKLKASRSVEETVLSPEIISRRKLPVNFDQGDLELFRHVLEQVIPATTVRELRDVRVSADGLLFKGGRILAESFAFPSHMGLWKKRSILKFFIDSYIFKSLRRFDAPAFWITDNWSEAYFHWVADALTRLFVVKDQLGDMVLLLPHQYKALKFVQPSLKPFGIRNIEFLAPDEVLACEKLIVPMQTAPSGHYNEEILRGLSDLLVGFYNPSHDSSSADRIYISRERAGKRRLENEKEVIHALQEFDFQIVYAEEHSFEQQVKMASDSRYLVSNHGAGLTNMLFMRGGTSVLELRHKTDRINNCYFTMASALNLNYFYQTCEPENAGEDAHVANLHVDVEELRKNLRLMIGAVARPSGRA
ncbi:MAG: glycosyltransferase family 61 protein [Pyrinomonadaceae bacterium]|nr:glycosyltransferase family 61 protein [Pyrinomonadaceae bacterium]